MGVCLGEGGTACPGEVSPPAQTAESRTGDRDTASKGPNRRHWKIRTWAVSHRPVRQHDRRTHKKPPQEPTYLQGTMP